MNPNHLSEDEQLLEYRKSKIIKITDKKIKTLKIERGWEGTGLEIDPIIIGHAGGFPLIVKICRNRLHYNIRNLTVDKLTCRNARNITIENCTIKHLKIDGCENLTLLNNTILKLKIVFTGGSAFIDNKFAQIDKLKQNYYNNRGNPIGGQARDPLACCLWLTAISLLVSQTPLWFMGLFPLGLILYLSYSSYTKNKRIRDNPENTYINNIEI